VDRDAHAVIDEAKAAGVYVFVGGIDEDVPPALVSADGGCLVSAGVAAPQRGGAADLRAPGDPARGSEAARD
jgi:hypothetical protein